MKPQNILNEKYKSKTIKKKHTINSDLLILKLGQNESKKIIMINEKLPERWPDNKENITLTKIKNKASVLYFNSKKTIKKEVKSWPHTIEGFGVSSGNYQKRG